MSRQEIRVVCIDKHSFESDPTFAGPTYVPLFGKVPGLLSTEFRRLRKGNFDLVVGVGGGYLRASGLLETLKFILAHLPQVRLASKAKRTVYLPQSFGPFRGFLRFYLRRQTRTFSRIFLRDDRSLNEYGGANGVRAADSVVSSVVMNREVRESNSDLVVSVRGLARRSLQLTSLASSLRNLSPKLYIQSSGRGNDDANFSKSLFPESEIISSSEFLTEKNPAKVVLAVRLHAALLALEAGHYVVHLAYERKGFGAFNDLGLGQYVFNVFDFDPKKVMALLTELRTSLSARGEYDSKIEKSRATTSVKVTTDMVQQIKVMIRESDNE